MIIVILFQTHYHNIKKINDLKLSVIILNWNGKNLLKRFLPSVVDFTSDFDIYLVDNNSEDNSIEFTKKNFPEINIIKLSKIMDMPRVIISQ